MRSSSSKLFFLLFIVVILLIVMGCGGKSSNQDPIGDRIRQEYSAFESEYTKYSGVNSSEVKRLYESNRNYQYADVKKLVKAANENANKNILGLNALKKSLPQEIIKMDNVSGMIDYSLEMANLQKQIAEAVKNNDSISFKEAYEKRVELEKRIERFKSYESRFISDAIADAKGVDRVTGKPIKK